LSDYGMKHAWVLLKAVVRKENENLNIEDEQLKWRKQQDEQNTEEDRQFDERWYYPHGSVDSHCKMCNLSEYECKCADLIQEEDLQPLEPIEDRRDDA